MEKGRKEDKMAERKQKSQGEERMRRMTQGEEYVKETEAQRKEDKNKTSGMSRVERVVGWVPLNGQPLPSFPPN